MLDSLIKWELVDHAVAEKSWDDCLFAFSEYSIFQGFQWGEYEKATGDTVYRLWGKHNEKVVVMLQFILRKLPFGCSYIWIPGGVVGDLTHLNNRFKLFLKKTLNLHLFVIRSSFGRVCQEGDVNILISLHWKRSIACLNSGLSVLLNPTQDKMLHKEITFY